MKDFSLYSGERYPTLDLELIGLDHLARYSYVASKLQGHSSTSLFGADIFCGSGYGSALIARNTNSVILAIDGSEEAIEQASANIHLSNIIFSAKLFPFDLPDSTFDFIVSFESIEHVKDHEAFFYVLQKSLKPGGLLFISAPNENVMPYDGYQWHFKHFTPAEIRQLAKKYGLVEQYAASTRSHIFKDGIAKLFYPYQINNDKFQGLESGDTLFFEFKKN